MRAMLSASPWQGNGRAAETVTPPGSSATVIASDGTPGSAICTCTPSAVSMMSTGGSHATVACVKNCRCRRSARSSIDSASLHIQLEMSRDLTGPRSGRKAPNQLQCKFRSEIGVRALFRLLQQPLAECGDRGPVGDDLGADEVIRRMRPQLHLEGRAQP